MLIPQLHVIFFFKIHLFIIGNPLLKVSYISFKKYMYGTSIFFDEVVRKHLADRQRRNDSVIQTIFPRIKLLNYII